MQWKSGGSNINMIIRTVLVLALVTINVCDGARRSRTSQRRKDTHRTQEMYTPTPSAESLQAIAEAMGAAGFEHYTEGRPLVKRLIPVEDQADLDLVEFQGVIGKAGVDFPAFPTIPSTGFNCKNVPTGYYADLETDCQVFHICDTSRKISFLCPNGTIFSQSHLICDWWFKVDCASAPALYESSAEYYSNEQKKTHKITQSLSKAADFIPDSNVRAESRRATVNVPSTTERLLRHRQKLQTDTPLNLNGRVTPRTLHALLEYSPTQRSQITTAFENRKRNLVQLISNNFGNTPKPTTPSEASTHRPQVEVNGLKEMQVAAETASFAANNNNRQFLQDYNKNYRPYPVYSPNTPRPKAKANPNLTTLYDIRDKATSPTPSEYTTTKRPTLVPYTKAYTIHNHRDPYTRPGVSLLKNFVQQERNRTLNTVTEKVVAVTQRSDNPDRFRDKRVTIETKDTYESVTKIPHTTLTQKYISETGPADKYDGQASTHFVAEVTTEPSYKERRDRLLKKLNLDNLTPTEPTEIVSTTDKNYVDLPNRPGLVVPPSLTPKTLHSLAIYYATALDNLSTVPPEDGETTTPSFEDYIENMENLPGLFSQQTLNKYSNLFGQGTENPELLEEFKVDPNGTYNELNDLNDLSVQQSQNPIATSPQIRELAQVFTHALSAYLQDPVQFRKVLSDIRPTQPSFGDLLTTTEDPLSTEPTTTVNEEDHEILGFSDDHKEDAVLSALREPKALNLATDYPTAADDFTYTTPKPVTEYTSTTFRSTTPRIPFKCCGRISASYITPAPFVSSTTASPITNTVALNINTLSTNSETVSTESSYVQHRFGGFQNNIVNNDSPYGNGIDSSSARPLSEYIEATNLPTAWGIDSAVTASTNAPFTEEFESKKISTTSVPTTNPVYFTETDSVDSENEEELQRAHSQSFIAPQGNSIRQGKQLNIEGTKTTVRKPSEELEAPTYSDPTTTVQTTTTTQPTTTVKITETEAPTSTTPVPSSIFTSPDSEKTTFIWTSNFDNWHSTVIDPITLNDGLSPTGPEEGSRDANAYIPSKATTADYTATTEQAVSSTARYEVYAPTEHSEGLRSGRLLKDLTSTEPAQDLSTITDTVVEKAKEIMGGMNATTTEKLMNVMKKTKSKTVRRLILLLVQTCDDDHNTTAEASKRALLEALMAVSQKDMDEIAKEEGVTDNTPSDVEVTKIEANRRTDRHEITRQDRRGKSINFDPSAINSLSSVSTEAVRTTQDEPVSTTQSPRSTSRRGLKKFHTKTDQNNVQPTKDSPIAEARVASQGELKPASDTRALELLRSLYTIAARWG